MSATRTVYQGKNMDFLVLGRKHVGKQEHTPDTPHILISITDPYNGPKIEGAGQVDVYPSSARLDILRLEFFDINEPTGNLQMMSNEQVCEIVDFVNKWKDNINLIVVNCEFGKSRSSGVAAALSKWLNGEDLFFYKHYHPNQMIYKRILSVVTDTPK